MALLKRHEFNTDVPFIGIDDDEVTPFYESQVPQSDLERDLEQI